MQQRFPLVHIRRLSELPLYTVLSLIKCMAALRSLFSFRFSSQLCLSDFGITLTTWNVTERQIKLERCGTFTGTRLTSNILCTFNIYGKQFCPDARQTKLTGRSRKTTQCPPEAHSQSNALIAPI